MTTMPTKSRLWPRIRAYLRVLPFAWRAHPRYALIVVVGTLAAALMLPSQIWISKLVIDRISATLQGGPAAIAWAAILTPVALYFLVWLAGVLAQTSAKNFKTLLGTRMRQRVDAQLLQKAATLSISFFETPSFYDQMNDARRESYRVVSVMSEAMMMFQFITGLAATLFFLARVSWIVPLVLLVATLPQVAANAHFIHRKFTLWMSRSTVERELNYVRWLLTEREPVKEIRLFQVHGHLLGRFNAAFDDHFRQLRAIIFAEERVDLLLSLWSAAGTAFVWFYAVRQAAVGAISLGDLALTFQATELCRNTLSELFRWGGIIVENGLYLERLFGFLDLPPDAVEGALAQGGTQADVPPRGALTFENVSFRYPGSDVWVLRDLSFTIAPGETVALVGENGAGKTTVVKLMARLYDPTEGRILYAGRDLRDYAPEAYYAQLGIIFQDFVRYDLPVRENIGFGALPHLEDRARIVRAAGQGGALGLIERLPHGFDTMLGRTFEEGVDLSGGEWQKIALSRAFMRDAAILILDEPTAALDARAEHDIYERFADLTAGKTTVFISHRLSSVKMAQRILLLEEGRLLEAGSHDALMAARGAYYALYTLQAGRYL